MAESHIPITLAEWLDDLTVRFLLNLPASELSSVPRLCFQVEEAQWFYEDFVRPAVAASGAPPLPSLPLRQFFLLLFQHCPLLSGFTDTQHIAAYEDFLAYKVRIPVRGAIMLDESMEKVVLVRGWKKGASWSFPRGKINKDEKDLDCAIREVWEETGYDVRQAGLIPSNEDDVKFIDITMREQHLRLFVFRGVPEDAYFEPRTRKEIGKIQWYNIRDLPGFKKHKDGEATHASKFYMVAPFLGQLKRWIGQQRKQDAAHTRDSVPGNGFAYGTATDDETDAAIANVVAANPSLAQRNLDSDSLRQMLNIGSPGPAPIHNQAGQPSTHASDLLSMLQAGSKSTGTSGGVHTPLDQVNAIAQPPQSPHPQHQRSTPMGMQQGPPPQFQFAQQHAHLGGQPAYPVPTPNIFESRSPHMPPNQPQFFHSNQQHGHLHQQPHQQLQPNYPSQRPGPTFAQARPAVPGPPPMQSLPYPPQPPQQQFRGAMQQQPSNAFLAQGPQGPLGSGPAVPKASQLPAPKLNAHSMKLLDAFKGMKNAPGPAAPVETSHRPTSSHQTALLGLLKQPSAAAKSSPAEIPSAPPATSSTLEAPKKDPPVLERKTTLNEITRTLPARHQWMSGPNAVVSSQPTPSVPQSPRAVEKTNVDQPFEPSKPASATPTFQDGVPRKDSNVLPGSVKILQSPRSGKHGRASGSTSSSQANNSSSLAGSPASTPKPDQHASYQTRAVSSSQTNGNERQLAQNAQPKSILARPGSSRASTASPIGNISRPEAPEAPQASFQPQLLKRPKESEQVIQPSNGTAGQSNVNRENLIALLNKPQAPSPSSAAAKPDQSSDKRENLVALLSKPKASSPSPAALTPDSDASHVVPPAATQQTTVLSPPPQATTPLADERKNHLLGLFSSARSPPPLAQNMTPTPPPAPRIEPERRPLSQPNKPATAANQNLLLDLFHRAPLQTSGTTTTGSGTGIKSPSGVMSPGTPISPFALGTPMAPTTTAAMSANSNRQPQEPARSRLGSVTSVSSNGGSGAETPKEAKEFLMGFLNGVVQKEGSSGGAGARRI